MPVIDFKKEIEHNAWVDTDICIIGSGAAGLAIANEFLSQNIGVFLVESGGNLTEPETQGLYRSEVVGLPHRGTHEGRFRTLGGATTKWGGQSLPLTHFDFQKRYWVPWSGWDLTKEYLESYYQRGAKFLFTDTLNFDSDLLMIFNRKPIEFQSQLLHYHFSKWSPYPNLREKYLPLIRRSENVTLLFHANVIHFDLNESLERVSSITVKTIAQKTAYIRAKYFIICCGGIETARLLLAGNLSQCPQGIGNQNDLVGRYFQDHPAISAGTVVPHNDRWFQSLFNTCFWKGRKYSVRFSASERLQEKHQILNVSGGIMFDAPDDSAYVLAKEVYFQLQHRQIDNSLLKRLFQLSTKSQETITSVYAFIVQKQRFIPRATARLVLMCEQEPMPNSRISLSQERDILGMPRTVVNWQLTDLPSKTLYIFAKTVAQNLSQLNLGEVKLESWLTENYSTWQHHIGDQNHHMGTTRMNISAQQGVVDLSCRLHQVQNLYIGGSSVFPTSGHSNPTLTAIALSIRIADTLKCFF
jgi:choline dehydrogenase-like flavoprotein